MAITRDRLRRAINNYLPSNLTVSRDLETGTVDPERVFEKLQTLTAAALVTDPNAVFYLTGLTLSGIQDEVDSMVSALNVLSSQEVLLSAEQTAPAQITSTEDLSAAIRALAGLSSGSGQASFTAFDSSLSTFQSDQLGPLVAKRNRSLIDEDIATGALAVSTALASMRLLIDRVENGLAEMVSADVTKLAASQVASAISVRLQQIRDTVEAADVDEQAEQAEDFLVDLLAARAALGIVFRATGATGALVVPVSSGAKTLKTYLSLQGSGELTPQQYVAKGGAGRPLVDYIYGSRKGSVAATRLSLTASIVSRQDISFPAVFPSGVLTLLVNDEMETVTLAGTFNSAAEIAAEYNVASTSSTATAVGNRIRLYAYKDDTDPIGVASSLEITGGDAAVLSGLRVEGRLRAFGTMRVSALEESAATLSSYTFPSRTTEFSGGTRTEFTCYVVSITGEQHRILAVDTATNTLTVSPGFLAEPVVAGDGTVSYGQSDINYIVVKSLPGTLFVSGSGASTSPTLSDADGTDLDTFLPRSAAATGSTGTSAVRHPMSRTQASASITAQMAPSMIPGTSINLFGTLLELDPLGSPAGPDRFAIGADEAETISNLYAALIASPSSILSVATPSINSGDARILDLVATAESAGASGNALAAPVVPAGFVATAFIGGLDAGSTWSGDGSAGNLGAEVRTTGADGTNIQEAGTAVLGAAKWSGTAGIAYKGYGSRTGSEWYVDNDGIWGKKLAESSASAGTAPSPSYLAPTNVMAFKGAASEWTTSDAAVYWDNTADADITAAMWFVMTAWAENGSSGAIAGPVSGVGGGPSTGTSGTAGTSFFITAVAANKKFTIKAPEIDVDGDGTGGELGNTWADFGWSTTSAGSSIVSMTGYFFDPNRFLITTSGNGFTSSYTTETSSFFPQVGDTVFYEKEIVSFSWRASSTISAITSNLEAVLTDPGGTHGANDFAFGRRALSPSLANSPTQRTGVKYTLVRDTATAKLRFYVSSATTTTNLSSKGVSSGDLLYISTSGGNSGWYVISSITSDGELLIDATASGTAPGGASLKDEFSFPQTVTWAIYAPDYQQRMTDASATFLTNGVSVGDTLTIASGSFAGNHNIAAVESETSILVTATTPSTKSGPFTAAGTPLYTIPLNDSLGSIPNHFFTSASAYFSGVVFAGDILTVGGSDYVVASISDSQTLQLATNFLSYFSSQSFTVRKAVGDSGVETTSEFTVDLSANTGLTDLLDINGIAVGSQIDIDTSSSSNLKEGYLQILSGASAGTYAISSVAASIGSLQVITLSEQLALSAGGDVDALTWKVLAGKTTAVFQETGVVDAFSFTSSSVSDFAVRPPAAGDMLILSPGDAAEERVAITSVESSREMLLEQEVAQGQAALRYAILPAEYPQAGDDLVVGAFRARIEGVTMAYSGSTDYGALRLSESISYETGTAARFYVVSAGGSPKTSFIQDEDPDVSHDEGLSLTQGFQTPELGELSGRTIQVAVAGRTVTTSVLDVVDSTTLSLSSPIDVASGSFFYRVLTSAQGKSRQLSYPATLSETIDREDQLTIWQSPGTLSSLEKSFGTTANGQAFTALAFAPEVESGLTGLDFVVTRGGGSGYGRFQLLLSKLSALAERLDAYKFADLNLRLAEVLSKHGEDRTEVLASDAVAVTAATAPDDGDGDATTARLDVSTHSGQVLEGLRVGDRFSVTYTDDLTGLSVSKVCWLSLNETALSVRPLEQFDDLEAGLGAGVTRCSVHPELPLTSSSYRITAWSASRSSISYALYEVTRLRLLLESVRDIVANYSVEASPRVDAALLLLRSEGYDRMADLLTSGQYLEFFSTGYDAGSYQELMKTTVREVGSLLLELRNG
jgi:hypothetical protein